MENHILSNFREIDVNKDIKCARSTHERTQERVAT